MKDGKNEMDLERDELVKCLRVYSSIVYISLEILLSFQTRSHNKKLVSILDPSIRIWVQLYLVLQNWLNATCDSWNRIDYYVGRTFLISHLKLLLAAFAGSITL